MKGKPPGWGKFHKLAKRLVAVPKDKVDARMEQKRQSTDNPQKKK